MDDVFLSARQLPDRHGDGIWDFVETPLPHPAGGVHVELEKRPARRADGRSGRFHHRDAQELSTPAEDEGSSRLGRLGSSRRTSSSSAVAS